MNIQIQIRTECSICKGRKKDNQTTTDMYIPPCHECAGDGYKYKWVDFGLSVDKWDDIPGIRLQSIPKEEKLICPNCKTEMIVDKNLVLTSDPPKYKASCLDCGYVEYIPVSGCIPPSFDMKIRSLPD